MDQTEKIKYIKKELDIFEESFCENPIEYQNDISPTVKEMCLYFNNKGCLSSSEMKEILNDNNFEPFMFYYGEHPVTNLPDNNYSNLKMAEMIASNDSWFNNFKENFTMGL